MSRDESGTTIQIHYTFIKETFTMFELIPIPICHDDMCVQYIDKKYYGNGSHLLSNEQCMYPTIKIVCTLNLQAYEKICTDITKVENCKALQSKTEFREMIIIQEKHVIFNPVKTIKFLSFTVLSDHSYVYSSSTNVTFNFRGNNYVLPFVEQKNDFSLYTYKWETHNKIDMNHYQYLIGALCGVFISFYSNFRICMCKNA